MMDGSQENRGVGQESMPCAERHGLASSSCSFRVVKAALRFPVLIPETHFESCMWVLKVQTPREGAD